MHQDEFLHSLGFPAPFAVEGRSSIADLYKPNHRCGIYVLGFSNGDWYCGQAVDVTRRYVQHSKNHLDITDVRFKEVEKGRLNEVEQYCIHKMESAKFRMRNITFMSVVEGETDFDLIFSREDQEKWLSCNNVDVQNNRRVKDDSLRSRYTRSFKKLEKSDEFNKIIQSLRIFIQNTIPVVQNSELSFWTVSCLPNYHSRNITIYSRININWQEVFTIGKDDLGLFVSIHMAKSPLQERYGNSLFLLKTHIFNLAIQDHQYTPGGQDQVNIIVNADKVHWLFEQANVTKACRLFNLRLMRKGPSNFARYHCLDLADRLV